MISVDAEVTDADIDIAREYIRGEIDGKRLLDELGVGRAYVIVAEVLREEMVGIRRERDDLAQDLKDANIEITRLQGRIEVLEREKHHAEARADV